MVIKKCKIYTKEQVNELDFPTKRGYFDADKDELKDYLSHIQNEKEYHMKKVKRNFCINCRKETDIMWGKAERTTNIKENHLIIWKQLQFVRMWTGNESS